MIVVKKPKNRVETVSHFNELQLDKGKNSC